MENAILKLSDAHFLHYRRVITQMSPAAAGGVADRAAEALARVGVSPNLSKSRPAAFEGSLTVDVGTMLSWMDKLRKPMGDEDEDARGAAYQLQILHATAASKIVP